MDRTYDALMIGGGIMGLSTALQLSRAGLKVGVLEKANIGAGSTGKSSAIIRQHYSNETTARMALESLRVYQNFGEQVGGVSGFTRTGFLVLTRAADIDGLHANVEMQRSIGIDTEVLDRDQLADGWPYLTTQDLVAAAYEPESGYADPNLTLNGFAGALRDQGAALHVNTEVVEIEFGPGRKVQGVGTTSGRFSAPTVVNCAGPWGAQVARQAGVDVPINPCRVQVAFLKRPADHESSHPVVADFVEGVYWRDETGSLTMVGLIDPSEADAIVDPDHYAEALDPGFLLDAGGKVVRRYPALERSDAAGGYAALYAITPDWHPIIDEAIPGSGFYICSGFSGHGFKLGPAVGRMTADMILGRDSGLTDRSLFRLSRFEEGKPVRGSYEYSIVG